MKKFIAGFAICLILMCCLIQFIHVEIEKVYDIKWCVFPYEIIEKIAGTTFTEVIKVSFKIFSLPVRIFYYAQDGAGGKII